MKKPTTTTTTDPLTIHLDEREMIIQRIETQDSRGRPKGGFYVARHYGSRECWIESKVLAPDVQRQVLAIPFLCRDLEVEEGKTIKIVSIDWLLSRSTVDSESARILEGISRVFDSDNSRGQCQGMEVYRNPL